MACSRHPAQLGCAASQRGAGREDAASAILLSAGGGKEQRAGVRALRPTPRPHLHPRARRAREPRQPPPPPLLQTCTRECVALRRRESRTRISLGWSFQVQHRAKPSPKKNLSTLHELVDCHVSIAAARRHSAGGGRVTGLRAGRAIVFRIWVAARHACREQVLRRAQCVCKPTTALGTGAPWSRRAAGLAACGESCVERRNGSPRRHAVGRCIQPRASSCWTGSCAEVSPRDGQGLVVGHGRLRQPQLSPRLKSRGLELQCLSSQVVPRPNGCRFLASELLAGWATGTARMALRIIYYALHGGVAERKHSMGALALFAME